MCRSTCRSTCRAACNVSACNVSAFNVSAFNIAAFNIADVRPRVCPESAECAKSLGRLPEIPGAAETVCSVVGGQCFSGPT